MADRRSTSSVRSFPEMNRRRTKACHGFKASWTRVFKMVACQFLVYFISLSSLCLEVSISTHIRGVATTKLSLYDSTKDFTCLDGSVTIPFSSVNDDYCDCQDGTDEPGTAACPGGKFHCTNAGFRPKYITSSRVNDAICDCCDGSDEYDGEVECSNTCKQLYKEMYEQRKQEIELTKQGYLKKVEYRKQGQEKKEENKQKLEELRKQLEEKKSVLEVAKGKKEDAEAIEKEAKEKHEQAWEETKAQILAERKKEAAKAAFEALDADSSGSLTLQEVMKNQLLDKEYTEDEAREMLGGYEESSVDNFVSSLWDTFKDKYQPPPEEKPAEEITEPEKPVDESADQEVTDEGGTQEATPEVPPTESPPQPPPIDDTIDDDEDVQDIDEDDDEDEEDEDYDEVKREAQEQAVATGAAKDEDGNDLRMPEYDEETKAKIQVADDARKEFGDAERSKGDIERETSDLERVLNMNFGQEEEFAPLHGECYEFTDREYRYKLCPFDRASQQPKDGGSETSLGTWGDWTGNPNLYSRMKYSGGLNCWNGPDRSAEVKISCGSANELVAVTEPNRCEYSMEFKTPAACQNAEQMQHEPHEEL